MIKTKVAKASLKPNFWLTYAGAGAKFDMVTANPPFVPCPPDLNQKADRYSLFADGGASGEEILQGIVQGLPRHLAYGGRLSLVRPESRTHRTLTLQF